MDCKLFDSKSVPATEIVCLWRKSWNPTSRSRRVGVRVSQQFCSSQGIFIKASYSTTRESNQSISWVGQEKFGFGNISSWFIGTNGASSSSSLRESNVLDASDDEYEGVVINSKRLPSNPNGKKGVWLKLPIERSELVPLVVKEGFEYHHAERGYIMLTYWIPKGPCMLHIKWGSGALWSMKKMRCLWCRRSNVLQHLLVFGNCQQVSFTSRRRSLQEL